MNLIPWWTSRSTWGSETSTDLQCSVSSTKMIFPEQHFNSTAGISRPEWKLPGYSADDRLKRPFLTLTTSPDRLDKARQCQYAIDRGCLCKSWTNVGETYCQGHKYQIAAIDRMWEAALSSVPPKKEKL